MNDATIAAVSTPHGTGGIAVIRISGKDAFTVADKVFIKTLSFSRAEPNRTVFGNIYYRNGIIDSGIAIPYSGPRSYTGDDTVEIFCHGGAYITSLVLRSCIEAGARLAEPGEFTRRAFLNGKITLTETEAVGVLLETRSLIGAKIAAAQTLGGLSRKISEIADTLKNLLSSMYVEIDYPGENLTGINNTVIKKELFIVINEIKKLTDTFNFGKIVSKGIETVILGKTNTGKSSFFNLITNREAAIVTHIPGTTRDVLETYVQCGDFNLNLYDTAGFRFTEDIIELEGIERTLKHAGIADIVIVFFDASSPPDSDDFEIIKLVKTKYSEKTKYIFLNKYDKAFENIMKIYGEMLGCTVYPVSVKENISYNTPEKPIVHLLNDLLQNTFTSDNQAIISGEVITQERQYSYLLSALSSLENAVNAAESGFPHDAVGFDIENAVSALCECDAKTICSDIVENIFRNFCVGK